MKEDISSYKVIDNDTLMVYSKAVNSEQLHHLFNVYTASFELLDTRL